MTQLFRTKNRNGMPATALDTIVASLQKTVNSNGIGFVSKSTAKAALSMESISDTEMAELDSGCSTLSAALESIAHAHNLSKFTGAQQQAATIAGILAGDIPSFLRAPVVKNVVANENTAFISPTGGDILAQRMQPALEAYDEKENRNAIVYSVAYNMQAARQDEFGEAFYPTVVVSPDQVGFTVSIRLIQVYNDVRRQVTGAVDQFKKRNIIQAVIDPTILQNDQTKIVPVFQASASANFVAETLMPHKTILLDGESIATSALALGKKFSLLGISQTDALLETGLLDTTDSIDTSVALDALYLKIPGNAAATPPVPDQVIKFNTRRLPTATFAYAVQGNYRLMNLNFTSDALQVNKNTKDVAGAALGMLTSLVSGQYSVRLSTSVSGSVNLELADTQLFSSDVTVARVFDSTGTELDITTGTGKTIADLFIGATMVGYDLDARRTNLNRRQRGQLLDTTFYNQIYAVPLRSPITVPRPLTLGDANDSSDLAALITATHIRTSNAAVEELLNVAGMLAEYVNNKESRDAVPEILGVARFLVRPFYEEANLDMATVIDSIKSHERAADIQAVLVNQLRDMAYRMYRDSGYKAAADALAGGVAQTPTVIIGTDPVLARYLQVVGDFRTLGNDFNVKVVSTLNENMAGKIVMSFGEFGTGKDGVPNPMHFGNMAWKPEVTLVLPLHRNGANSKELTVQPSFLHVTNLPIMAVVNVTGIPDVVAAKVSVNMHTVA